MLVATAATTVTFNDLFLVIFRFVVEVLMKVVTAALALRGAGAPSPCGAAARALHNPRF
jgi:hypothetical protein